MNDSLDPTLLAEREHLDKSRVALGRMRSRTEAIGDNTGDELTAWALGRLRRQRLADLADRPDTPLFFGRLQWPNEDFHVGRRHVVD
ncbi:MAG: AAA family ATPase, partial [Stackebrandtia sp.]